MKFRILLFLLLIVVIQVQGQTTVTHYFNASGKISGNFINGTGTGTNDPNLSISTVANSAAAPAYNSGNGGHLRLYSVREGANAGNGNELIIIPVSGVTITEVSIVRATSSGNPSSVTYSVDGGLRANFPNTISSISALNSFSIKNEHTGGGTNIQLHITSITVTYTTGCNPANVTTNPSNQSVTTAETATFTVAGTGTVQWQENTGSGWINLSNGGVYSGVTTTTLSIANPLVSMNGNQYRAILTQSCDNTTDTSNPATLSVIMGYCTVSGGISNSGILRVRLNTIDETTVSNVGYTNNTTISTNLMQGTTHNLIVNVHTNGNFLSYVIAWIDWNQNGVFESSEQYQLGSIQNNVNGQLSTSINVPSGASIGNTRMRISANTQNTIAGYAGSCEGFTHGEVEDYTINVITSTPQTELTLTQNTNPIAHNTGAYNFGNQLVGTSGNPVTFTIENTGNADLNLGTIALSGINANQFSVTQATSPITEETSTTFTVTFSPTSLGNKTATINIPNNDNTNYSFTVTGVGSNSALSDILINTGFSYTNNINYSSWQSPMISNTGSGTNGSIGVLQFTIRDGGGTSDSDSHSTILNAISFTYIGTANTIRSAALFNGNSKLADGVVTANGISFSALNIEAPDNGNSSNITLRVSFMQTVTDNQKLIFTVSSAVANTSGSVFGSADAGGGSSDNNSGNDRNRIEVTADRLAFVQQPSNTNLNVAMTPAVTVSANDVYGNRDLDFSGSVSISSYGDLTGDPVQVNAVNGLVTFNNLVHTAPQTDLLLEASYASWSVESEEFDITGVTYSNGDYRTNPDPNFLGGTWTNNPSSLGTVQWQRYNGTNWVNVNNEPTGTADNYTVFISKNVTVVTGASNYATAKIHILDGGNLIYQKSGTPWTFRNIIIDNNGTLQADTRFQMYSSGNFEIKDGGNFVYNYQSNTISNSAGQFFGGTEIFHQNSNFIIKTLDSGSFLTSTLLNVITPNSHNSYFGNIIVDYANGENNFILVTSGSYSSSLFEKAICNDLIFRTSNGSAPRIYQPSSSYISSSNPLTIQGDFIVESTYSQSISFTTISHSSGSYYFKIKGNFINNGGVIYYNLNSQTNNNALYYTIVEGNVELGSNSSFIFRNNINSSASMYLQIAGNLLVANSGVLQDLGTNASTKGNVWFDGTSGIQTIDFKNQNSNNKVDYSVRAGANVRLINQDLKLGNTGILTVKTAGIFDFGFDGTTALNLTGYGTTGTGFISEQGSYLKITSPNGIVANSGSIGNVQTNTAPVINNLGTFHYIGKQNQVTGTGFGTSSNGRAVIVEMDNDNLVLTPSASFGVTNGTNPNINGGNGGVLDLRKGRFIETQTEYVTGSTGSLKMAENTYYEIIKSTDGANDFIPRMSGTYDISGGEVHLASIGNQTLRGGKAYHDLIFSGGVVKTVSNNSTPDIEGMVYIKENTTLDVSGRTNNGFGKNVTELLMDTNSKFIVDGASTRPQLGGDYVLDPSSEIEFKGTSATQIRVAPEYANITISGTNVTAGNSETAGITMQDGTIFTVKDGAFFKVSNPQGLYGNAQTAIKNSPAITFDLEENSTIEYNALATDQLISYLNGYFYGNVLIRGNGSTKKMPVNSLEVVKIGRHLILESDGKLEIEEGKSIIVNQALNNQGEIIVKNNGNFIQLHTGFDNNTQTGNFIVERITRPMNSSSFTYWGSPVQTNISNINWYAENVADSGNFNTNVSSSVTQRYAWNPADNPNYPASGAPQMGWYAYSGSTTPANGFIVRAPGNFPATQNDRKKVKAIFQGIPYNGEYHKTIVANGGNDEDPYGESKMTFLSNPYPSAVNIDKFLLEYGEGIAGVTTEYVIPTAYFWTHATTPAEGGGYSSSDFATYTLIGGTATSPVYNETSPVSEKPEGEVASGQGFFIMGTSTEETVTFKNSYRYAGSISNPTGYDNSIFFRTSDNEITFERHRFWLNLTGENTEFKQTLIGYSNVASDDLDGLDGAYYEGGNPTNLYTTLNNYSYVIQAFALPFEVQDVIPLGYKVGTAGNFTISLDDFDGLFEDTDIYIKDNLLNSEHNLKNDSYVFLTESGEFTERFEIIFQTTMDVKNSDFSNNWIVYSKDNQIHLESLGFEMKDIYLYDMLGREVYSSKNLNSNRHNIGRINANQVLIVKIVSQDGQSSVKKFQN